MQATTTLDEKQRTVQILDIVNGKQFDAVTENIEADHKTYFYEHAPDLLEKFIGACESIAFLHTRGEKHGDIRRDHVWVKYGSGTYRSINFDE